MLSEFGSRGSADLELESTIVYVDREAARKSEQLTIPTLTQRVRDVKPRFVETHILEKGELPASVRKRFLIEKEAA